MLITRNAVSEQVVYQEVAKVEQLKAAIAADAAAIETAQTTDGARHLGRFRGR
jgi:hypothetical protein